jgi:hypothetical protein
MRLTRRIDFMLKSHFTLDPLVKAHRPPWPGSILGSVAANEVPSLENFTRIIMPADANEVWAAGTFNGMFKSILTDPAITAQIIRALLGSGGEADTAPPPISSEYVQGACNLLFGAGGALVASDAGEIWPRTRMLRCIEPLALRIRAGDALLAGKRAGAEIVSRPTSWVLSFETGRAAPSTQVNTSRSLSPPTSSPPRQDDPALFATCRLPAPRC